jgi:hypothetical protein
MRFVAIVLLLGLASCREKQADPKAVLACMSSQPTHDEYLLVTRCEPLGKSERIAGTWFVAFEMSLFKEGEVSKSGRLTEYHQLVVPTQVDEAVHKVDATGYAAYDVVFVGRQSLLQLRSEPTTFVADKIISMRRVQVQLPPMRPSSSNGSNGSKAVAASLGGKRRLAY